MSKRRWMAAVALSLAIALVAGCGGGKPASPADSAGGAAGGQATGQAAQGAQAQPVTVVHWQHHHEGRSPVLEELIGDFRKAHPNVTIQTERIPYDTYFDKLIAALSSNSGPDVFQIPLTMAAEMIASGRLAPLPENVLSAREAQEKYVPWTVELVIKDGKVWGLPTDVQTLVMFINVDLARAAGLDPAKPPKTWTELKDWARRATKKDANGLVVAGLDTRYKWADFNLFLTQALDGKVVDFDAKKVNYDSPAGLEAFQLVQDLMVKDGVDSPRFLTGQQKFEQKKAVLYINHPVTRGRLDKLTGDAKINFTVALPPAKDGKPLQIPGHSWVYVLNKASKNPAAAAEWIKFLGSRDAIKKWAVKAGDLPSLKELLNDPEIAVDQTAKVGLESMNYAVPVRQTGAKDVDDVRAEIWDNIVIKGMAVDEAVKAGAAKENAIIARKLK